MKAISLLFATILLSTYGFGQFQYDTDYTAEELVMDFFNSGVLVSVSDISFNGIPAADTTSAQLAYFFGGNSAGFNIDEGILLSTGYALQVFDPDSFPDFIPFSSSNDPDMIQLSNGANVNHCAVIEFDAVIDADAVAFNFVFGSHEYPSFTCSQFNDVFGLFISGPGIAGPFENEAENIATIPESNTPIAINTINSGIASGVGNESNCEEANPNWQADTIYFVDNGSGDSSEVAFPGYTTYMEAYKEIIFGEQYHFKFAICDVIDGALDSGVFLEAGSFEGRLLNTSSTSDRDKNRIKVFPNPATESVQLETLISADYVVVISNLEGRVLRQVHKSSDSNAFVDLSGLDSGIYILQILSESEKVYTQKLVKR